MKKVILVIMMLFAMLNISYASSISLKELKDFTYSEEKTEIVDIKAFNSEENLKLKLTAKELEEMKELDISKLEIKMYYLSLKIKLSELLGKGNIEISSEHKNDLYHVKVHSSKYGEIKDFNTKVEIKIPYEIDEESYYITMYGVDENEQIINFRGAMDEETNTVSVRLKNIEIPLIPVVNKIIYKDLEDYSWAKKYIEESAAKGLLSGKKEGIYAPEQNITRAEFVTLLLKTLNLELIDSMSNFEDVNRNNWYYNYVVTADYYDLTSGVSKSKFLPEESITRQDIAVMVGKSVEKFYDIETDEKVYEFSDEDKMSEYAIPYLAKCLDMELISGYEDNTFKPEAYATRAEAAVIINKLFDKINEY